MVDQSHNLKPKIEAMIQTVMTAQKLFAKACLVDRDKLRDAQARMDIVAAEDVPARCVLHRHPAAAGRVAQGPQAPRQPARCLPRERL